MFMSKVLEYVVANLERFTTFHLLLVLLLSGLVSAGMFFVFRWLYLGRLDAQAGLLSLRMDEVSEYRRRYEQLVNASNRGEGMVGISITSSSATSSATSKVIETTANTPSAVALVSALMRLNYVRERIDMARRFLAMYATVFPLSQRSDAPRPKVLTEMLDRTAASLGVTELDDQSFEAAMSVAAGAPNASVPEELLAFPYDKTYGEINAVLRETGVWIERIIEEEKKGGAA